MGFLADRIHKVHKHLSRWAKRESVFCYRLYQRDLNDFPVIVDWYDGDVVVWLYERKRDETDEQKLDFIQLVSEEVSLALNLEKKSLFIKHRYKLKGLQTQYEKIADLGIKKIIVENGLNFEINLTDYLDTGLFLDHRKTREWFRKESMNKHVLNLFSYTGSFSCYAMAGGASSVTTVDLNPNYISWAQRNVELNGFRSSSNEFIADDCRTFLKNSDRKFDLIMCDPPTFSNSKRTQEGVWCVDDDYSEMIQLCASRLSLNGKLLFSTNSKSFQFDISSLSSRISAKEVTGKFVPEDFKNRQIHRSWEVTCSRA